MVKIKNVTKRRFNKNKRSRRILLGGDVIDSGGYGCVFRPSMSCRVINSLNVSRTKGVSQDVNYISKIMTRDNANSEFNILRTFSNIIKGSGYSGMFRYLVLSDITLCDLNPTREDIQQFNTSCSSLAEKYNSPTMNGLVALKIPYGGKNLLKMFNEQRVQIRPLNRNITIEYFKKMLDLYNNCVYLFYNTTPKIIHGDLKEENIICIYDPSFTSISSDIKVIDWGLSFTYSPSNHPDEAVNQVSRRPLQFNLPFGILLFSEYFTREYTVQVLRPLENQPNKLGELVRQFCQRYYDDTYFTNGKDDTKPNVLKDFNTFVYLVMVEADGTIGQKSLPTYIRENLEKILIKYTYNGTFQRNVYAWDYYLPMVDSYGFMLTYANVLSYLLHARKNAQPSMSYQSQTSIRTVDTTQLILFMARQLKTFCLEFNEKINGKTYRNLLKNSISQMTNLCIRLLK